MPLLAKRAPEAPDIKGSVITDDEETAAVGGTDYSAFEEAAGGDARPAAAPKDEDSEDEGEKRAAAKAAAARKAGGRVVDEDPVPAPLPRTSGKQKKVKTLYDFAGTDDDELPFKKGEILTVLEEDEGW